MRLGVPPCAPAVPALWHITVGKLTEAEQTCPWCPASSHWGKPVGTSSAFALRGSPAEHGLSKDSATLRERSPRFASRAAPSDRPGKPSALQVELTAPKPGGFGIVTLE